MLIKLKLDFRLIQEQKKLNSDLDCKQNESAVTQIQKPGCDNEDDIETIKVNLRCVDEIVKELEENILQIENSQVFLFFFRFI